MRELLLPPKRPQAQWTGDRTIAPSRGREIRAERSIVPEQDRRPRPCERCRSLHPKQGRDGYRQARRRATQDSVPAPEGKRVPPRLRDSRSDGSRPARSARLPSSARAGGDRRRARRARKFLSGERGGCHRARRKCRSAPPVGLRPRPHFHHRAGDHRPARSTRYDALKQNAINGHPRKRTPGGHRHR